MFRRLIQAMILFLPAYASAFYANTAADTFRMRDTFCTPQMIIVNNRLYGPDRPKGVEVLVGKGANGADSVVVIDLTFLKPAERTYEAVVCEGDTIWINKKPYHANHWFGDETIERGAQNGCDSIVHVKVKVIANPFSLVTDTICEEGFIKINGTRYDRDNRSGLEVLPNASFRGCDSLIYIALSFRRAYVYLGEDQTVIEGDMACIAMTASEGARPEKWEPAAPCAEPYCDRFCFSPQRPVEYRLTVKDELGCIAQDEIRIGISRDHLIYGPNVFKPGADKPNDRFYIFADKTVKRIVRLTVLDRWGETVFYQQDVTSGAYDEGWDGVWRGKEAPTGVYTWEAELETLTGRAVFRTGTVTLLR